MTSPEPSTSSGLIEPPLNSWKIALNGLSHDIGEHVEPAAMRHAEHDFLDPQRSAALDDLFERRHHRFSAVDSEALGAGVFDVEKLLETFRLDQLVQDGALAFRSE